MPTLRQWSMAFCALAITSSAAASRSPSAADFPHEDLTCHAPTFFGLLLGGTGYIIVGDNGLYCQPLLSSHFYCHFNIQIVSGVIPVQTSDAPARDPPRERHPEMQRQWGRNKFHPRQPHHTSLRPHSR